MGWERDESWLHGWSRYVCTWNVRQREWNWIGIKFFCTYTILIFDGGNEDIKLLTLHFINFHMSWIYRMSTTIYGFTRNERVRAYPQNLSYTFCDIICENFISTTTNNDFNLCEFSHTIHLWISSSSSSSSLKGILSLRCILRLKHNISMKRDFCLRSFSKKNKTFNFDSFPKFFDERFRFANSEEDEKTTFSHSHRFFSFISRLFFV